jgi:hypothetical protein
LPLNGLSQWAFFWPLSHSYFAFIIMCDHLSCQTRKYFYSSWMVIRPFSFPPSFLGVGEHYQGRSLLNVQSASTDWVLSWVCDHDPTEVLQV